MSDQTVDLYRLISETVTSPKQGDPTGGVTYTYDPVGNRQTRVSTLPGITSQNPAYDSGGNDRMTSDGASPSASFSYDLNGSVTQAGLKTGLFPLEKSLAGI